MTIPEPSRDTLQLAFDTRQGKRIGPYAYRFDLAKIVRSLVNAAEPPRLDCQKRMRSSGGAARQCEVAATQISAFAWGKVSTIRYGRSSAALTATQKIDLGAKEIFDRASQPQAFAKAPFPPVFSFDPPADWTDLYYVMKFTDGSETPVQRIPLRQ